MKKFLSLVLALIMTMSLVTISAGATEYKDLTDKDEIQYEEAVAVLNRLGIITGYSDGSFQPEGELTRGAAAKIIVSLLIGPEAAANLPNDSSPYPDVPAGYTFAGVISFCKTSNIISGYSDGTFKPGNSLTGFAFAKMLLGALGYDSDIEHFTGTGWVQNIARVGHDANLFDRLNFDGSKAVNREEACQLALNTLKATMVEYTGGFNITAGEATVTGAQTRTYVTSNQDYAKNIDNRKASQSGNAVSDNHYTVEFGEVHFKDLRLNDEHKLKLDDFGRPSNHWSYKKVTIGVFPVEPDFTYNTQVEAKDNVKTTAATKIRALGLNGYEIGAATELRVNGKTESLANLEDIADYTDNGTVVEVYVSEDDADFIRNVVVVKTQLMEVKKQGADYVTLESADVDSKATGYNQEPIDEDVDDVEVEDAYYEFLKGLKTGDKVAVIPLTTDNGASYTVSRAYTPESVTGSLDGSKTFANANVEDKDRGVVEVTVGGTAYKVALWNKDLNNANRDIIKVTKKDVTLLLDEFGNAMLAKDIGSTSEYMILGAWRNSMVNGVLVRMATGWDVKGNPVSLNVGAEQSSVVKNNYANYNPGDVLRYSNDGVTGNAEWSLTKLGVYEVPGNAKVTTPDAYAIKASNSAITLGTTARPYPVDDNLVMKASGIKTIYVAFDGDEVDYIEIKDGLKNISYKELRTDAKLLANRAEATVKLDGGAVTKKSEVTFVIVKQESNDATLKNLGYVYDIDTTNKRDENGDIISDYKVFTVDEESNRMLSAKNVANRRFVRFNLLDEEANMYDLRAYDRRQQGTSVMRATIAKVAAEKNNCLLELNAGSYTTMAGVKLDGSAGLELPNISTKQNAGYGTDKVDLTYGDKKANLINIKGAKILDLTNSKINDADDLEEAIKKGTVYIDIAFNDNPDNDEFRLAYIVVVTKVEGGEGGSAGKVDGTAVTTSYKVNEKYGQVVYTVKVPRPDWVPADAALSVKGTVYVDGIPNTISGTFVFDGATGTLVASTPTGLADEKSVVKVDVTEVTWGAVKAESNADRFDGVSDVSETVNTSGVASVSFQVTPNAYQAVSGTAKSTVTVKQGADELLKADLTADQLASGNVTLLLTKAPQSKNGAVTINFDLIPTKKDVKPDTDMRVETNTSVGRSDPADSTKSSAYLQEVRDLGPGAYVLPNIDQDKLGSGNPLWYGGTDVHPEDCIVIVYERDGSAGDYTLVIDDEDTYTEKASVAEGTTTNGIFNVQVSKNKSTAFYNAGTGTMGNAAARAVVTQTPLDPGRHTFEITSPSNIVVAAGEFYVEKVNDIGESTPGTPSLDDSFVPSTKPEGEEATEEEKKAIAAEWRDHYVEEIKNLPSGVYVFPDVADKIKDLDGEEKGALWIGGSAADNRLWRFEDAGVAEKVTFTMWGKNAGVSGDPIQKDSMNVSGDGSGHYFYFQVSGEMNNSGDPKIESPLEAGSYAWEIRGEKSGIIIQGTFVMTSSNA